MDNCITDCRSCEWSKRKTGEEEQKGQGKKIVANQENEYRFGRKQMTLQWFLFVSNISWMVALFRSDDSKSRMNCWSILLHFWEPRIIFIEVPSVHHSTAYRQYVFSCFCAHARFCIHLRNAQVPSDKLNVSLHALAVRTSTLGKLKMLYFHIVDEREKHGFPRTNKQLFMKKMECV